MARKTVGHKYKVNSKEISRNQIEKFVKDIGATHHICYDETLFLVIGNTGTLNITPGYNIVFKVIRTCEVDVLLENLDGYEEKGVLIHLANVFRIEYMGMNLLSLNDLDIDDINVTFKNDLCILYDLIDKNVIGTGFKRRNGLYQINVITLQRTLPMKHEAHNLAVVSS